MLESTAIRTGLERQFQNRLVPGVPDESIHRYPMLEMGVWWRTIARSSVKDALRRRNDAFQEAIPDRALDAADAIIGFDTSSDRLAERARTRSIPLILDRSIAHSRRHAQVTEQIEKRYPEWHVPRQVKTETELRLEDREHDAAHVIVVPSTFVADSLTEQGVAREKIRINSFGTDLEHFRPAEHLADPSRIIYLFVGAISARKGIPLLLEAWRRLKPGNAELWIAGTGAPPSSAVAEAGSTVRWLGPVSRRALPDLLRRAHVFVFPSFFEGLAQVQIEAAACALPIIATTASGGDEIVEDAKTGFIIDPGNLDQLVDRIERFATHPEIIFDMNAAARRRVGRWSWRAYGDRWHRLLDETT
jgi:glycosyltransferase involved in cell wall biosynthesis